MFLFHVALSSLRTAWPPEPPRAFPCTLELTALLPLPIIPAPGPSPPSSQGHSLISRSLFPALGLEGIEYRERCENSVPAASEPSVLHASDLSDLITLCSAPCRVQCSQDTRAGMGTAQGHEPKPSKLNLPSGILRFFLKFLKFFCSHARHVEVPRSGIELAPQ